MEYGYTAIDGQGLRVQAQVQAEDDEQALRHLHAQGYVVLALSGVRARRERTPKKTQKRLPRVRMEAVVALTRELAIMVESGVPLVEAIASIAEHADNPAIADALQTIQLSLNNGRPLAQSMSEHPNIFSPLYVSMVRNAEAGGSMDTTLNHAADYHEAALEMRRRVNGALAYPMVLLFVTVLVIVFMLTYIIPQFAVLFTRMHAQMPAHTRILLQVSQEFRAHWWLIPPMLVGSISLLRIFFRHPTGRRLLTRIAFRIPALNDLLTKIAVARLLRVLGTLLETGVSLLHALELAGTSVGNDIFERAIKQIRQKVSEGLSLTQAVHQSGIFPPMILQMVGVGEKSGRMSSVLLRVSRYYEQEVDARLKMLSTIIEPIMIVTLGLIVAFMAISIIGPIYSMVGSVK